MSKTWICTVENEEISCVWNAVLRFSLWGVYGIGDQRAGIAFTALTRLQKKQFGFAR